MPGASAQGPGLETRAIYSSGEGRFLSPFFLLCRFLESNRRSRSRFGTLVRTLGFRRSFEAFKRLRRISRAAALFLNWLRDLLEVAISPVGRWVSRTPDSVRFWCCPPFPPAVKVSTRHCSSSSSSESGKGNGEGDPRFWSMEIKMGIRPGIPIAKDPFRRLSLQNRKPFSTLLRYSSVPAAA